MSDQCPCATFGACTEQHEDFRTMSLVQGIFILLPFFSQINFALLQYHEIFESKVRNQYYSGEKLRFRLRDWVENNHISVSCTKNLGQQRPWNFKTLERTKLSAKTIGQSIRQRYCLFRFPRGRKTFQEVAEVIASFTVAGFFPGTKRTRTYSIQIDTKGQPLKYTFYMDKNGQFWISTASLNTPSYVKLTGDLDNAIRKASSESVRFFFVVAFCRSFVQDSKIEQVNGSYPCCGPGSDVPFKHTPLCIVNSHQKPTHQ